MRTLGIAIIGYGGVGRIHGLAYRAIPFHYGLPSDIARIIGVSRRRPEAAEQAAREAGGDRGRRASVSRRARPGWRSRSHHTRSRRRTLWLRITRLRGDLPERARAGAALPERACRHGKRAGRPDDFGRAHHTAGAAGPRAGAAGAVGGRGSAGPGRYNAGDDPEHRSLCCGRKRGEGRRALARAGSPDSAPLLLPISQFGRADRGQ